jgi:hypothetical protein
MASMGREILFFLYKDTSSARSKHAITLRGRQGETNFGIMVLFRMLAGRIERRKRVSYCSYAIGPFRSQSLLVLCPDTRTQEQISQVE